MKSEILRQEIEELEMKSFAREMIEFIDESPSTYHVVNNCSAILVENGFTRLQPYEKWNIELGGKYFIKKSNSSIVAFTVGKNLDLSKGFKMYGSHTDSPTFRIKPNPEMVTNGILRLNTEVYGGPILYTWFDRPLSIAGRVIVKGEDAFRPRTIGMKIDEPILIIPSLAIHQNRDVNNGFKIDKQNDTLPFLALLNNNLEKENYLINLIAKRCNIDINEILDFDLYLYSTEKGSLVGANEEFVSAPKIDNLVSVYTGLLGLVEAENADNQINVFVGFDNEEIGSATKQGADSNYLEAYLERIIYALGYTREDYLTTLASTFMLSADGAHAAHPAHLHKSDPTNLDKINEGVSIKISASQRYTSDGFSIGVIKEKIKNTNIKIQYFVNNSNERGGSTIGPISSTHLGVDAIDIGVPMLSMHSIRELCGVKDLYYLKELAKVYFSEN